MQEAIPRTSSIALTTKSHRNCSLWWMCTMQSKAKYKTHVRLRRRQRQNRVLAIERLDGRLLVHAEHRCMLWRVQVQPDHLGRLDLEVRVIGGQIAFHSVRLDAMLGPDATDCHVRDVAQFARQL